MFKSSVLLLLPLLLLGGCQEPQENSNNPKNTWAKRQAVLPQEGGNSGTTYLSIYSQVYSLTEHKKHSLTVTVSMRNTSTEDTLYLSGARYFDTHGKLVKNYTQHPVYITPMETLEIVIDEKDPAGGTGANFLFDWTIASKAPEPFFEAVMISTAGSQGLSFTTQGRRID